MQNILQLLAAVCAASALVPTAAQAGFFSNPPVVVSSTADATVLRMDLNGYANYGLADAAADVAYTGDSHTWSFTLPAGLVPGNITSAFFRTALVLDDHANVDPALYSLQVSTANSTVFNGNPGLPHGGPFNSVFGNWQIRDFAVTTVWALPPTPLTFGLRNTSATGASDWIAVDWLELHVVTSAVPEPQSALLFALGIFGVVVCRSVWCAARCP